MNTNITCRRCSADVSVPGTKNDWRCDSCNVLYWGYKEVLELPLEDDVKREILKTKSSLSPLEEDLIIDNREEVNHKIQEEEEDRTVLISRDFADPTPEVAEKEVEIGWLIMKTEEREESCFQLMVGYNYIGRPFQDYTPEIAIADDIYVSRFHALLKVIRSTAGDLILILSDNDENIPKGYERQTIPSRNGCYLNGDEERLSSSDRWELSDGETIQIGETKLVLKLKEEAIELDEARTQVLNQDFEKTVLIPAKKVYQRSEDVSISDHIAGWLVWRDENEVIKAFELKLGENKIGRKYASNRLDIALEADQYISRFHARLYISEDQHGVRAYTIYDDGKNPSGKPSSSGTYINGDKSRLAHNRPMTLTDADNLQIGKTNLILVTRPPAKNEYQAIEMAKRQGLARAVEL